MDTITFKVDRDLAKAMEKVMKPLYSTKTEFIREAIRKHVKDLEMEEIKKQMKTLIQIPKHKTTLAEMRKIREEVSKELLAELKQSQLANMPKQ